MKDTLRWAAALVVGLVLFALPFARYALGGHHDLAGPHRDHGPRHGGHLLMLRGYHAELVEHDDAVELYLSDSTRKPLRPSYCRVTFDGHDAEPCEWKSYRSLVAKPLDAQSGLYELAPKTGPALTFRFP